ncbi:MAG TPA: hypothetical protein VHB98_12055, partial [Chloroflexota bacterium]|nr:hypothetical protein [Chloroflexota bacterium]
MKSLRGKKDASPRSSPGNGAVDAARPHLTIVRAPLDQPETHRGMWNDDPLDDPTALTQVSDWPTEADFAPLIAGAKAAGAQLLVAQLEADRAFCAAA